MEKFQEQTGSTFYSRPQQQYEQFSLLSPLNQGLSPLKAALQLSKDRSTLDGLQGQANRLKLALELNKAEIETMHMTEPLRKHIMEIENHLQIQRADAAHQQSTIKIALDRRLMEFERLVNKLKAQWRTIKEGMENEFESDIIELKKAVKNNRVEINTIAKTHTQNIKTKLAGFQQELRQVEKSKQESSGALMLQMERVRMQLNEGLARETTKRKQCNQTLFNLLDDISDRAKGLIRRRLF